MIDWLELELELLSNYNSQLKIVLLFLLFLYFFFFTEMIIYYHGRYFGFLFID